VLQDCAGYPCKSILFSPVAVARKRNEIGKRMALGAERSAILGMVLRETATIVAARIAVGLPAAGICSSLL
jgi:ABC-type antimicrobial peptide transport system permease subunit